MARASIILLCVLLLLISGYAFWLQAGQSHTPEPMPSDTASLQPSVLFEQAGGFKRHLSARMALAERGDDAQICTLLADADLCSNVAYGRADLRLEAKLRNMSPAQLSAFYLDHFRGSKSKAFAFCMGVTSQAFSSDQLARLVQAASLSSNLSLQLQAALRDSDRSLPEATHRQILVRAMMAGDYRAAMQIVTRSTRRSGSNIGLKVSSKELLLARELLHVVDEFAYRRAKDESITGLRAQLSEADLQEVDKDLARILSSTGFRAQAARNTGPNTLRGRREMDCPALTNAAD